MFKTISIIMISFLFTLLLAPVMTPVKSNINNAFAELGECPACWAWYDNGAYHIIACRPTPEDHYWFWVEALEIVGGHHDGASCNWIVEYAERPVWLPTLMVLKGLNRCECDLYLCCHEYTACWTNNQNYEATGNWAISDGIDNFDPDTLSNNPCYGLIFASHGPSWAVTPTPTITQTPTPTSTP
jgi:hypothetical protein